MIHVRQKRESVLVTARCDKCGREEVLRGQRQEDMTAVLIAYGWRSDGLDLFCSVECEQNK